MGRDGTLSKSSLFGTLRARASMRLKRTIVKG
jgi:hypothetical protein